MLKQFTLVLIVLLVVGCGSSPPVDFYTLQPIRGTVSSAPEGSEILGLGPLTLPDYLQRPQLVTQTGGGAVRLDEFNRWAEPLEVAMPRVVATNVDQLVSDLTVIPFPWDSRLRTDYRLLGRVNSFGADAAGLVVLEVQWGIQDRDAKLVLQPRRDRYQAQASSSDVAAVVVAMNSAVEQFSRDIASQISTVRQARQ
ncbi:MAG: PqiC family protein [Gammaproteobacteria bacterium]